MGASIGPIRALLAATSFLTCLPVARRGGEGGRDPLDGAVAFPLVGAATGGLVAACSIGLSEALPALLAATLAVGFELVLTGALHLDGLGDSADGLGGRERERALEIMRDHALGTYGAAAIGVNLLARVAALGALAAAGEWGAIVAAFAVSRAAPFPLAHALPYARSGAGLGRGVATGTSLGVAAAVVALAVALAVLFGAAAAIAVLASLAVVCAAVGFLARARLGGVTGDVMGAAVELTATLGLVAAAAWIT